MALVDDLRAYVNLTHALAWDRAMKRGTTPPDEPGLVASFLDPSLQTHLQSILMSKYAGSKKLNMQLNSIFTHKTPVVLPTGASNGVEIADLLLIRQHFAIKGIQPRTTGRALLLQAKRNALPNSGNVNSGNPRIQFDLYQSWPPFRGSSYLSKGPNGSSGTDWNFYPAQLGSPPQYGHYLAVFDGHAFDLFPGPGYQANPAVISTFPTSNYRTSDPDASTWANAPVSPKDKATVGVNCHTDFAKTLEQFVLGATGQMFTPGIHSGTDHWSIFVNRMLQTAALPGYTYTSTRTGVARGTLRGRQIQAFQAIQPFIGLAMDEYKLKSLNKLLTSEQWDYYIDFPYHSFDREYLPFRESAFMRDVLSYGRRNRILEDNDEIIPPDSRFEASQDFDDFGHVPVMILATSGDSMPEEFVDSDQHTPEI